jgi:hypothetical protein
MVTNTRDLLGMPNHQDLPQYRVLLRIQRVIDHDRNRMNITDVDWILNTWRLAVDPSTDTFAVSAPSWGRPVLITSVSDAADSDPMFVKRTYPLCDVPDAHLFLCRSYASDDGADASTSHSIGILAVHKRRAAIHQGDAASCNAGVL